jgi:plastocyanin
MTRTSFIRWSGMAALFMAAACGGEKQAASTPPSQNAAPSAQPSAPAPAGKTIVVEMITDGTGNFFKPAEIEAKPGDVIRYTLKVGVHNVHFLADSNPGVPALPATSDMLQLPGQTFDVVVNLKPGRYYFQCDPHAALGMRGHIKVEG